MFDRKDDCPVRASRRCQASEPSLARGPPNATTEIADPKRWSLVRGRATCCGSGGGQELRRAPWTRSVRTVPIGQEAGGGVKLVSEKGKADRPAVPLALEAGGGLKLARRGYHPDVCG